MGKHSSAPAAPDPVRTAQAQAQANSEAVRESAAVNQINQVTPYGSVTYSGAIGSPGRTQTTTLSPAQQAQLNNQNQLASVLGENALTQAGNIPTTPFSTSGATGLYGVGEDLSANAQRTQDAVFNQGMNRVRPMLDQQKQDLANTLNDRGIPLGSPAYEKEMNRLEQSQGDQINNLSLGAVQSGNAEQSRLFGVSQAAHQQNISDSLLERTQPINEISAFLQGTPALQQPQGANTAQYNVAPPDVMGAFNTQYQGQMNAYNQQQQTRNSTMGGLFGLGSAAILASDRRIKYNIQEIGRDMVNGLKVYVFSYLGSVARHIGYMAQEVEEIMPHAVIEIGGVKHVNYSVAMGGV